MALLGKEAIFSAEDRAYEVVPCPEWGGEVRMRSITGRERDSYEQSLIDQRGGDRKVDTRNARAKLIVLSAVDEAGTRLFSEADITALGRKNARPIDRLFDAARRLSGLSEEDVEKLAEDFVSDPDDN
jgi:hypothetical protein